ncbi:hypothetical protein [Gracilibacillus timonensis]|nr:hypothetical protein [Gracilibacillus timonensis]
MSRVVMTGGMEWDSRGVVILFVEMTAKKEKNPRKMAVILRVTAKKE